MEKFKNALKSVNKFGLVALVLVAFATLAFTPSKKQVDVTWRLNGSTYEIVQPSQEYFCDDAQSICTATYPEGQNPNLNPSNPTSQEQGLFTEIQ